MTILNVSTNFRGKMKFFPKKKNFPKRTCKKIGGLTFSAAPEPGAAEKVTLNTEKALKLIPQYIAPNIFFRPRKFAKSPKTTIFKHYIPLRRPPQNGQKPKKLTFWLLRYFEYGQSKCTL